MNRSLHVLPEAEAELIAAAEWYESKLVGLGVEFVALVDEALGNILDAPEANPVWKTALPFRKYVLRRFPYVISFVSSGDMTEIVAIAHSKRAPGYWLDRT